VFLNIKQRRHDSAHNDISHSTQLPCQYLISYSPGGSTRREVGFGVRLRSQFWGRRRLVSDGTVRKSDVGFL